jgi:hypothetical protein
VSTSPTSLSLRLLRQSGYTCDITERWLPKIDRRRDLFGFADLIGVHPIRREIVLVQTTTRPNLGARLTKAKALLTLGVWLRAGGLVEFHGWEQRNGRWTVKRVAVQSEDLADVVLSAPPRRRRRTPQRGLFDAVGHADAAGGTDGK